MHSEQPPDVVGIGEELGGRTCVHHLAAVEDDDVPGKPLDDRQVLLDKEDGRQLSRTTERGRDPADEQRREALRRLVDEEHLIDG